MANCAKPVILAGAVEGSLHLLVSMEGYADSTVVYFSSQESGTVVDEKALIPLNSPLKANQNIRVYVDDNSCKVSSCEVVVSSIIPITEDCLSEDVLPDGMPTGYLICDGIDLVREVSDGKGGYKAGSVVVADCIYCGGVYPNCNEEEIEEE